MQNDPNDLLQQAGLVQGMEDDPNDLLQQAAKKNASIPEKDNNSSWKDLARKELLGGGSDAAIFNFLKNIGAGAYESVDTTMRHLVNPLREKIGNGRLDYKTYGDPGIAHAIGSILPYFAGGEALAGGRAALAGMESIPALARAARAFAKPGSATKFLGELAANAGYGAASSPEEKLKGALTFGGAFTGGKALEGIGEIAKKSNPGKALDELLSKLSGGKDLTENRKSLGSLIKENYEKNQISAKNNYDQIMDTYGKGREIQQDKFSDAFMQGDNAKILSKHPDTAKAVNEYLTSPSLDKAHVLQSQIGSALRSYPKFPNMMENLERMNLKNAQKALQEDIHSSLRSHSPELEEAYKNATNFYKENVIPYRNKTVGRIISKENPEESALNKLFRYNTSESEGATDLEKVVKDLRSRGGDVDNSILYHFMGHATKTKNPQSFVNAYKKLDQQGLTDYLHPEVSEALGDLVSRIESKGVLKKTIGALAGSAAVAPVAHLIPGGAVAHAALNAAGALGGMGLVSKLGSQGLAAERIGKALAMAGKAGRKAYPAYPDYSRTQDEELYGVR